MQGHYFQPLINNTGEPDQKLAALTTRLGTFYNTFTDYPGFTGESKQSVWLELVVAEIRKRQKGKSTVRVLEAGSGVGSTFSNIDGVDRTLLHYTAQDITPIASNRLAQVADAVHIGPLETLQGQFDVIFSCFVLEHIPEPSAFLSEVDRLLVPGGTHIVICPRYDFPGYICPSMRHMRRAKLFQLEALRTFDRLRSRLGIGAAGFWINTEPAVLHMPWFRDSDAVHVVSRQAVTSWHRRRGYQATTLMARNRGGKDWLIKRALTLSSAFNKPVV